MTLDEAWKIFKVWQDYQEILDKLHRVFTTVPESFLPYSIDTLDEALNMVAKYYFDGGDKKASENIQESMARYLLSYYMTASEGKSGTKDTPLTDEEVISKMKRDLDFMIEHPELLKTKLEMLKKAADSWTEFRKIGVPSK